MTTHGTTHLNHFADLALLGFVSYLWPIWDTWRQTLHDKLAGTVVLQRGASVACGPMRWTERGHEWSGEDVLRQRTRADRRHERRADALRAWGWVCAILYLLSLIRAEERQHWHDPVSYVLLGAPLVSLAVLEVRHKRSQSEPAQAPLEGQELFEEAKGLRLRERRAFLERQGYYATPAAGHAVRRLLSTAIYMLFYVGFMTWVDVHDDAKSVVVPLIAWAVSLFMLLCVTALEGLRRHRALSERSTSGARGPESSVRPDRATGD